MLAARVSCLGLGREEVFVGGGTVIKRSNKPATIVGTDLCKIICRTLGHRSIVKAVCKVVGKVRNFLGRGVVSVGPLRIGNRLRLVGAAPKSCLNSYHCGLPRSLASTICPRLFRGFRGCGVNCFFCVNKGSSVSAMDGLSHCTRAMGDRVHFVKVPGAVSGSLILASRAPKFKDTTGCMTSAIHRVTVSTSICSGGGSIAVIRVVNHRTK